MLDDILEIILDVILEVVFELVFSPKVPMVLRVILGILVFGALAAIIGLVLWVGINSENIILVIISIALLIAFGVLIYRKFKEKYREK